MLMKNHHTVTEIKSILTLGLPLIASQLVYACSGFIGTAMVAKLGPTALAASVLVSTIWSSVSVFFFGSLNAVSVMVAHQYGARNYTAISEIMGQSFLLGILICFPIILILHSMPLLLAWSGQPQSVTSLASEYARSYLWTIPPLILLIICEQFLTGIGKTKFVLRLSLLVVPVEIPLIYLLVFGKLGLPACGLLGVNYGFAITYTLSAMGILFYLYRSNEYKPYHIFNSLNCLRFKYLQECFRIGTPIGFMHTIEVGTFALATIWMGRFGTTLLAAHQIVLQFLGLAITVVFAMSQAVAVRVGYFIGSKKVSNISYTVYVGMWLNFGVMLLVAMSFIFMPHVLLSLDMDIHDPNHVTLLSNATSLLYIASVLLLFDNFRIVGGGALRGLKDTRYSMYAAFFGFWVVGLISAYIFSTVFSWQGKGIWWGLTLGIASSAILVLIRLQKKISSLCRI